MAEPQRAAIDSRRNSGHSAQNAAKYPKKRPETVRFRGAFADRCKVQKGENAPGLRATGERIVAKNFRYENGASFDILTAEKRKPHRCKSVRLSNWKAVRA